MVFYFLLYSYSMYTPKAATQNHVWITYSFQTFMSKQHTEQWPCLDPDDDYDDDDDVHVFTVMLHALIIFLNPWLRKQHPACSPVFFQILRTAPLLRSCTLCPQQHFLALSSRWLRHVLYSVIWTHPPYIRVYAIVMHICTWCLEALGCLYPRVRASQSIWAPFIQADQLPVLPRPRAFVASQLEVICLMLECI